MTLKEAVESGKPFRHNADEFWLKVESFHTKGYSLEELISDDWEIQSKEAFTRSDVEKAIHTMGDYFKSKQTNYGDAVNKAMKAAEEG